MALAYFDNCFFVDIAVSIIEAASFILEQV